MSQEFSPAGSGAKMTKSQVQKYIKDMKKAQKLAKEKLKKAKKSGEFKNEKAKIKELEKLLEQDNLYN